MKLLIIADDFTGALDTGVQFAAAGVQVKVITKADCDLERISPEIRVLVLDAETRHLDAEAAYAAVYETVRRARKAGIPHILKKTDSALRGNVGAELSALLDASGLQRLAFLPACPQMDRITRNGVHYIDGLPAKQSVFGKDPYDPVRESEVEKLIHMQSSVPVRVIPSGERAGDCFGDKTIDLYDAEDMEELRRTAAALADEGQLSIMAGCAGLGAVLPGVLKLEDRAKEQDITFGKGFLIACGSVNPISIRQIDHAVDRGFQRHYLTPLQKLEPDYWDTEPGKEEFRKLTEECRRHERFILDSNDLPGRDDTQKYAQARGFTREDLRQRISCSMGRILRDLLEEGICSNLMVTGGDTLLGFLRQMGVQEMEPVCEMAPGTVLSRFIWKEKRYQMLSKSGGFGHEGLLVDLYRKFSEYQEKKE